MSDLRIKPVRRLSTPIAFDLELVRNGMVLVKLRKPVHAEVLEFNSVGRRLVYAPCD